ncbi:beta-L-arabinofuranosidase domain-containing protein [Isoptericola jiangsuensis]|uniref:beta-L-arabinofuranosidase domain-containing protein n=1 Tax=Isoptericola jiangsuensis TaxID=548579 RepID=UPI003AAE6EF1
MAAVLRTPDPASVRLDDPLLTAATQRGRDYLLGLSAERLLFEFYRVAGLPPTTAEGYGGWERSDAVNFRGHTLGHHLSALAASAASCRDDSTRRALLAELRAGVVGLERCQDAYAAAHPASAGYVSAFRESVLDQVQGTGSSDENVLVPWYDLHKVLAGLLDTHEHVGGRLGARALRVATRFGLAVHRRVAALDSCEVLLRTEYGGMNEALYRLLAVTGDVRFRQAAEAFDEVDLFRDLAAGYDVLPGRHANTTIPKLIGALARYRVLTQVPQARPAMGDVHHDDLSMYRTAAEQFFDIVLRDHTYVTGANSQAEHFHAPGTLHERAFRQGVRGNAETAETCNTYNMRRLARALYELTGDERYARYDELALRNHVLASQHPERGTTTYFNAMAPGYHKVVHTPETEFWCCTGTGMESFASLGATLYALDADGVRVDGFHPSALDLPDRGLRVVQDGVVPASDTVTIRVEGLAGAADRDGGPGAATDPTTDPTTGLTTGLTLRLRVPDWADRPRLTVDGVDVPVPPTGGHVVVPGLVAGATVTYRLPARVTAHPLPDEPSAVAFRFGPDVLSAGLGPADTDASEPTGILVRISDHDPAARSAVTLAAGTTVADTLAAGPLERLADAPDDTVRFRLRGTLDGDDLVYAPHRTRWDERYAIYLHLEPEGSPAARDRAEQVAAARAHAVATVDELTTFDANNFENAKDLRARRSVVGTFAGRTFRAAEPGGRFSYRLAAAGAAALEVVVRPDDPPVAVRLDGAAPITVRDGAAPVDADGFVTVRVAIPDDAGQDVEVAVAPAAETAGCRVFGLRTVAGRPRAPEGS